MKKCIAGLLALVLLLSGCGAAEEKKETAPLNVAAPYTQLEAVGVPQMLELEANTQWDR